MKSTKLIINRDLYWAHRYALFAIAKVYREICNDQELNNLSLTIFDLDLMIKSALSLLKLDTDNLENITEMHKLLSSKKTMEALVNEFDESSEEVPHYRTIGINKHCIVLGGVDIGTLDSNTKSIVLNYPIDKEKILKYYTFDRDKITVKYEFKED